MKHFLFFLSLFSLSFFNNYFVFSSPIIIKLSATKNFHTNKNQKDTIFIQREKTAEHYHKIYIEKNRNSNYYKLLTNFKFVDYDLETVRGYNKSFKKRATPIKKFDLQNIPKEWLPLYKYKSHYYLYAPSDWGNTGRKMITKFPKS